MPNHTNSDKLLAGKKFIPVVILNDVEKAVPLARALLDGGIGIMEVTLRTKNALHIIEKIANEVPEMTVGAGTVLNTNSYHLAIKHGAEFIVSPGLSSELIEVSSEYDTLFIPGVVTPSEIMHAIDKGFNLLKFFPAENFNGYATLKAYTSIFKQIKFCPTGGITLENARKYLDLNNVSCVGCSFLAPHELINDNNFKAITDTAQKTLLLLD